MIKVFTTNKNNKIEFTKEELQKLLDEAYWDGYRANSGTWTYTTPNYNPSHWYITTSSSGDNQYTVTYNDSINNINSTAKDSNLKNEI